MMSDLEALIRDARAIPPEDVPEMNPKPPRLWLWLIPVVTLIVASANIQIFWPIPADKKSQPLCEKGLTEHCYKVSQKPSE